MIASERYSENHLCGVGDLIEAARTRAVVGHASAPKAALTKYKIPPQTGTTALPRVVEL